MFQKSSRRILSCNSIAKFFAVSLVVGLSDLNAQAPVSSPAVAGNSLVEFINGTSVPAVVLGIGGIGEHANVPQGAKIAGGAFPITDWKLTMHPKGSTDVERSVGIEFRSKPDASSTAVLIGDFQMVKREGENKPKPRASIVVVPGNLAPNEQPNRLMVLNGVAEKSIEISVSGVSSNKVDPMSEKVWHGLPKHIVATAKIEGREFEMPIEFVGSTTSVIVVFYLKDGEPSYVATAQALLKARVE